MQQKQTVRISVEVRSGASRFRVGVQSQSIREALSLVGGRYPGGVVEVVFPKDSKGFSVHERTQMQAA